MSKTAPKEFTKEAVAFFDGGVTINKSKKGTLTLDAATLAKYSEKCYIILHGKVYDVTDFLAKHPGGPESILQVAGKDCTVEFEDIFHSQSAREQVKDFYVGNLAGYEGEEDALMKGTTPTTGAGSIGPLLIPAIIAVLAVVYFFTM